MDEPVLATLGIAAAVINFIALLPYLRDILRHKTKPERATWWVWFAIATIGLFAQLAAGARWSVLLTLSSVICVGIIAVLSIRFGFGKFHRRDTISLAIAGLGIGASFWLHDPLYAVLVVIGVDLAGTWLTISKAWIAPDTETLSAWVLAFLASICGLLAVGTYYPARYLYPLYGVLANGLIVAAILYRRPRVERQAADF